MLQSVDLPLDSGPMISTMRPSGIPPMRNAPQSMRELPVGTTSTICGAESISTTLSLCSPAHSAIAFCAAEITAPFDFFAITHLHAKGGARAPPSGQLSQGSVPILLDLLALLLRLLRSLDDDLLRLRLALRRLGLVVVVVLVVLVLDAADGLVLVVLVLITGLGLGLLGRRLLGRLLALRRLLVLGFDLDVVPVHLLQDTVLLRQRLGDAEELLGRRRLGLGLEVTHADVELGVELLRLLRERLHLVRGLALLTHHLDGVPLADVPRLDVVVDVLVLLHEQLLHRLVERRREPVDLGALLLLRHVDCVPVGAPLGLLLLDVLLVRLVITRGLGGVEGLAHVAPARGTQLLDAPEDGELAVTAVRHEVAVGLTVEHLADGALLGRAQAERVVARQAPVVVGALATDLRVRLRLVRLRLVVVVLDEVEDVGSARRRHLVLPL